MGDLLSHPGGRGRAKQEEAGLPACLLVPDRIRAPLSPPAQGARRRACVVLAHSEIPWKPIPSTSAPSLKVIVMNVRPLKPRTAREALARGANGAGARQAVILSNRPTAGGVEVMAMAEDALSSK